MKTPPEIGTKFGRWTVIDNTLRTGKDNKKACLCKCECGNIGIVVNTDLRTGHSKSCGCYGHDICKQLSKSNSQGESGTRLYKIWEHMRMRCYNPKNLYYKDYGERGISICDEWKNDFHAFKTWALKNGYSDKLTIDRINNNGNYEPSNCRWATHEEQQNNTRWNRNLSFENKTQSLSRWAREKNIPISTLYSRLDLGWDIEKALTYPIDKRKATKRKAVNV